MSARKHQTSLERLADEKHSSLFDPFANECLSLAEHFQPYMPTLDQSRQGHTLQHNGTARSKNVNNCLNTNISFYLETSGGQNSNLYLNVALIFNISVNQTSVAA